MHSPLDCDVETAGLSFTPPFCPSFRSPATKVEDILHYLILSVACVRSSRSSSSSSSSGGGSGGSGSGGSGSGSGGSSSSSSSRSSSISIVFAHYTDLAHSLIQNIVCIKFLNKFQESVVFHAILI
jgi:hypothetical protein